MGGILGALRAKILYSSLKCSESHILRLIGQAKRVILVKINWLTTLWWISYSKAVSGEFLSY